MQIPRFFLTQDDVRSATPRQPSSASSSGALDLPEGGTLEIVNDALVKQIKTVLRLGAGDRIQILNGKGLLFESTIEKIAARSVTCYLLSRKQLADDNTSVCLALAVLKGERFDWALQKATELGAARLVPLLTERTVVKIDTADAKGLAAKMARWQSIVREAAEQSERAMIPDIVAPRKFNSWIDEISAGGTGDTAFICAERISARTLRDILLDRHDGGKKTDATTGKTTHIIVGPEGGFTSEEIACAQNQGIMPVSLGKRILRSETAAIYALAQVMWCLEK